MCGATTVDLIVNACDARREGELSRYLLRDERRDEAGQRLWLNSMNRRRAGRFRWGCGPGDRGDGDARRTPPARLPRQTGWWDETHARGVDTLRSALTVPSRWAAVQTPTLAMSPGARRDSALSPSSLARGGAVRADPSADYQGRFSAASAIAEDEQRDVERRSGQGRRDHQASRRSGAAKPQLLYDLTSSSATGKQAARLLGAADARRRAEALADTRRSVPAYQLAFLPSDRSRSQADGRVGGSQPQYKKAADYAPSTTAARARRGQREGHRHHALNPHEVRAQPRPDGPGRAEGVRLVAKRSWRSSTGAVYERTRVETTGPRSVPIRVGRRMLVAGWKACKERRHRTAARARRSGGGS